MPAHETKLMSTNFVNVYQDRCGTARICSTVGYGWVYPDSLT